MNLPFWFLLLQEWRDTKGQNGTTLPFLVGAAARARDAEATPADVRQLLMQMQAFRHEQEIVAIRYCGIIRTAVISVHISNGGPIYIDDELLEAGASEDAVLDSLARSAEYLVAEGRLSRIGLDWKELQPNDLEFIDSVITKFKGNESS